MSMDEMLLNELYGSEQVQQDEQVKQAQVELVEAVAAEAGVDLNELDDEELAKFAHYVLSDEDEIEDDTDLDKIAMLQDADLMGRQMALSYMDQLQNGGDQMYYDDDDVQVKIASAMDDVAEAFYFEKLAEEDNSGRNAAIGAGIGAAALGGGAYAAKGYGQRALARLDDAATAYGNQRKQLFDKALNQGTDGKLSINRRIAMAERELAKMDAAGGRYSQAKSNVGAKRTRMQALLQKAQGQKATAIQNLESDPDHLKKVQQMAADRKAELGSYRQKLRGLSGGQMAALGLGGAALGGGAAYLLSKRKNQEKSAALADYGYEALAIANLYEPEDFAKEAEYRAAEILLANGVDPETFEDVYPEHVKIASFPGVEDAADYEEALALTEYNDMLDEAALHIIDSLF
jgi:hypothetical protein